MKLQLPTTIEIMEQLERKYTQAELVQVTQLSKRVVQKLMWRTTKDSSASTYRRLMEVAHAEGLLTPTFRLKPYPKGVKLAS